jgi:hypothetical protein
LAAPQCYREEEGEKTHKYLYKVAILKTELQACDVYSDDLTTLHEVDGGCNPELQAAGWANDLWRELQPLTFDR